MSATLPIYEFERLDAEAERVAVELGLMPFERFAARARARYGSIDHRRRVGVGAFVATVVYGRGTGRSTRIRCHALAWLRRDPEARVSIEAGSEVQSRRHCEALRGMADQLGIDPRRVLLPRAGGLDGRDVTVFWDHE